MIYLIDDKKDRQEKDYNWKSEKLQKHQGILVPIYTLQQIEELDIGKEIFNEGNVILLHESFFDNTTNRHQKNSTEIRKKLNEHVSRQNSWVVYFSGSKSSRTNSGKIAHVPVSILYENLEVFLEKLQNGDINLDYILFGNNPKIENELLSKLEISNDNFDDSLINTNTSNFVFQTEGKQNVPIKLENAIKKQLSTKEDYETQSSDTFLNELISRFLYETKFDNIFIPLCFGATLSDFNGLRLASMIRCTKSKNQLSNIFIYGFVGVEYIFDNEYFNILKTKNVELIDYKKANFEKAVKKDCELLLIGELAREISKLKLEVPDNYDDNHSIANEWSIYRWANTIGATDKDIEQIENKVENQLYFKYLQTIFPISNIPKIEENELKIKDLQNSKILYIDDEADKGWYEVFCKILVDINEVQEFHYLGDELKDKSQEKIINLSLGKIKEQDTDIVILDFRLHESDFTDDISKVTGLKILKEIKKINPGIQVIIFSATNKVWNLQALQNAGADGFIFKESPENSVESKFTEEIIRSLIYELDKANQRRFLKRVFNLLNKISSNILNTDSIDETEFDGFLKLILKQTEIIKASAKKLELIDKSTIDIVYLNCFNFLEHFKNEYYLKYDTEDYAHYLGLEKSNVIRYSYNNKNFKITDHKIFVPNNVNDKPSFFNSLTGIIVDYFGLCDYENVLIVKLAKVTEKRNNFIHGSKDHFDQNELEIIVEIMEKITNEMKE